MKVDFNNNQNTSPSFQAVNYEGLENVLRHAMNADELKEFKEIVKRHESNNLVDMILFHDGRKFSANIADNVNAVDVEQFRVDSYSQRFFESSLGFIKRMSENVGRRTRQVTEIVSRKDII